jgi:hypothetical protein
VVPRWPGQKKYIFPVNLLLNKKIEKKKESVNSRIGSQCRENCIENNNKKNYNAKFLINSVWTDEVEVN